MSEQIEQHIKDHYEILKKIGSGAYGHVWKVKDKETNEILALKKSFDAFQHSTDAQRTFRQISYLKLFNHQNIVKLKKLFKSNNQKDVYLIFDHMDADLHRVIREDILQEKHKRYIIYQVAKAIKYLHSAELMHRDLKPSNILLNQECLVKLCDFGLIRSIKSEINRVDDEIMMTDYVATRWYRAPELLLGWNNYSKPIDIWSFGCLIGQMFKNKPMFPGSSTIDQLQRVLQWTGYPSSKQLDKISSNISDGLISSVKPNSNRPAMKQSWFVNLEPKLKGLLSKMLQFNPDKRITIEEVLEHPYLAAFHNDKDEPSSLPIQIQTNDSIKLSVKAYRQKIWKLCTPIRSESSIQNFKRTQHISFMSRSNKKRFVKGSSHDDKPASVPNTQNLNSKKILYKPTLYSPMMIAKQNVSTKKRQSTLPDDLQRKIYGSSQLQRYKDKSLKHYSGKEQILYYSSNKGLNEQQRSTSKKRSISTVKNRKSIYCRDIKKNLYI